MRKSESEDDGRGSRRDGKGCEAVLLAQPGSRTGVTKSRCQGTNGSGDQKLNSSFEHGRVPKVQHLNTVAQTGLAGAPAGISDRSRRNEECSRFMSRDLGMCQARLKGRHPRWNSGPQR